MSTRACKKCTASHERNELAAHQKGEICFCDLAGLVTGDRGREGIGERNDPKGRSDNNDEFPFTPDGYPTLPFIDFWKLMDSYLSSNRSFYLCPADRGPWNFVAVGGPWAGMGLTTNQLPFPNSYYYLPGLYSADDNYASPDTPRQRFVNEVTHPTQKFIMKCSAERTIEASR